MKSIAVAATALFAGLAAAATTPRSTSYVVLTLWAAADNTFTVSVPVDGSYTSINSDLSFTSVSASSPVGSVCHVYGVDGSDTVLYNSQSDVPIGPPQVQTYATCKHY